MLIYNYEKLQFSVFNMSTMEFAGPTALEALCMFRLLWTPHFLQAWRAQIFAHLRFSATYL